ncbi:DUF4156 domain-containing protein [Pseudohongiella sp.]|uniref:DUF4156 domain-containing protein n=1 Tax=marine sediment metagenome TaxID=412755 RepID=A0A0F9Z5S3_9ZZZZ|nr:DUF4156 domain-containing protein [Pseudohongiella sp.]HDZ09668.1 DUF4156 domain-containing protein [Pseudohongiella sp.]HEA61857.1 DUF4156 domain-containing protein [Pseudohongiella sp.]
MHHSIIRSIFKYRRLPMLCALPLILAACGNSWVQVTPEGERVSLATAAEINNCRRIGAANVNALDSIGFVNRGANRLQDELVNLARNEAGEAGGNRVVPESTINEGRQTFGIYQC